MDTGEGYIMFRRTLKHLIHDGQHDMLKTPSGGAGGSERLVEFKTRTDDAVDSAHQHHQARFEVAVQCDLVHTVQ